MTKKQERVRARRRHERHQAQEAERAARRTQVVRIAVVGVVVLALVGGLIALAVLMGEGEDGDPAAAGTTPAGCSAPPQAPGTAATLELPDASLAEGRTFTAVLTTNCGDITIELHGKKAPQTVASFVHLAREDFWRDSPCHRLTTGGIHVLQCGDPTGVGTGGPGYGFGIENAPEDGHYPRGTVAMARSQDPQSNGSQFFIVHQDTDLPTQGGGYSIFGTVTDGMDIVDRIADAGVAGGGSDGAPVAPISILSVAVTEKKA